MYELTAFGTMDTRQFGGYKIKCYARIVQLLKKVIKKTSIMQHNNLKKIQRSLMDYYKQVLHLSLEKFSQPDLTKIGMYNLTCEIVRYTYICM